MSRRLEQEYKALALINATAKTASYTSGAVAVETYGDDSLAIVTVGDGGAGFTAPVYIVGSLSATPSTYDQVLATFPAATVVGIAAQRVNLAGIANVKGAINPAGSTSITASVALLVKALARTSAVNSSTVA